MSEDMLFNFGGPYNRSHRNKYHISRNIIFFGAFFLVLSIVLYSAFFGNPKILGSTIFPSENDSLVLENGIKITADLTIPELSTRGNFNEIIVSGQSPSFFYIENEKIEIPSIKQSTILIKKYAGKLSFDKNLISINGKARKVFTEDIPISPKSKDYIKIEIMEDFGYSFIEIANDFSFKTLEYETSGTITLNRGTIISLNNEKIKLEDFIGTIQIFDGRMKLDGKLTEINVEGEKKISVYS